MNIVMTLAMIFCDHSQDAHPLFTSNNNTRSSLNLPTRALALTVIITMSREAESWFLEESIVAGESVVTEIFIVESKESMFDFGIEVSERAVETETKKSTPKEQSEVKDEDARVEPSMPSHTADISTEEREGLSSLSDSTGSTTQETKSEEHESRKSISIEAPIQKRGEQLSIKGREESSSSSIEENNQDESSISSGERERATQEAVFKSRYKANEVARVQEQQQGEEDKSQATSSKSALTEKPAKDDLEMTDYSDAYNTFETNDSDFAESENQGTASKDSTSAHDSNTDVDLTMRSTVSEALNDLFRNEYGYTTSNSDLGDADKYDVSAESSSDAYPISSKSNVTEVSASEANDKDEVKIVDQSVEKLLQDTAAEPAPNSLASDSNVTEKSVEVALDQVILSVDAEESDIMADSVEGRTEYSLGHNNSSGLSDILKVGSSRSSVDLTEGSRSEEETLDSSVRREHSLTFENSLESYEGNTMTSYEGSNTMTSYEGTKTMTSLEGNTVSSYEGTGTVTSGGSSVLESSFSDEQDLDDPLKMFDIAGWVADSACGARRASSISMHEATLKEPYPFVKSKGSQLLKEKLKLFTTFVKSETPLKHLHVEKCNPARAPLSPKSTTSNNTDIFFGKTPKHANTTVPQVPKEKIVMETLNEEPDNGTVRSTSEDAGDENAPEECATSPKQASSAAGSCSSPKQGSNAAVSTSEDMTQAGIRRMKLQNKVLSGARKKMEAATLQRQHKAAQESPTALLIPNSPASSSQFVPFSFVSEDLTENASVGASVSSLSRNRWKKPMHNYIEYAKRKSPRARRNSRMRRNRARNKNAAAIAT